MARRITHIVLHYTATYADQNFDVNDIRRMHLQRGFRDVGYHYVIKRDGTIQPGRPEDQVGAHVGGHNTNTIGIATIGGLERATGPNVGVDNRTQAQKNSTYELVTRLLQKYPGAKVVGHKDLAPTQCPGFDVASWWKEVTEVDAAPAVTRENPAEEVEKLSARVDSLERLLDQLVKLLAEARK